jgi:hypothetical protein
MCEHWLEQQSTSSDGGSGGSGKHQHLLITFMTELLEHCAFGKLHTAKSNQRYAQLIGMNREHVPGWSNNYNSEYILVDKVAQYASFQALLRFLRNPSDLVSYTETELEKIVDGFVCLCALHDSHFRECFAQYDGKDKDAFFIHLVNMIETIVGELWHGQNTDVPVKICNFGPHGTGRGLYYNIQDCYFPPDNSR